ncbi:MAG: hypothetical protein HQM09_24615 [Candidatus Riflebacteria bacterium]|nr:hypothetical protein [Candidatus Riflebacteria bacterium]
MNWIEPWRAIKDEGMDLVSELKIEVSVQHVLFNRHAVAIACRCDCDDVLFRLDDGSCAVVHLTWSGKREQDPGFPSTTIHNTLEDFVRDIMLPDAEEYGYM